MKIEIEIPKEFESDYNRDRLSEFFSRAMCDMKYGTLCGKYEEEIAEMLKNSFANGLTVVNSTTMDAETIAVIERAKTLLAAYREMYDRSEREDRFYGKSLSELTVVYDEAECDSSCLYDDMGTLLDDIEDLDLPNKQSPRLG